MCKIKIHKPGLLTTVQDLGRYGYQQFGMPVSGAMDTKALKLANYLVGNDENEACLEATADGPKIEFECDIFIAICGADMQAKINGKEVEMYKTLMVKTGDILTFGKLINGFRTYISFAGGIQVPVIMGSKSTYLRGGVGGFKGRKLKKGDVVAIKNDSNKPEIRSIEQKNIPVYRNHFTARIIPGPEADHFTVNGLATFLHSEYTIAEQSDRMGYRLAGNKIEHKKSADIISSGIAFGTIQVPAHGQPIIMMADRQTTGGYTRIATIISEDLPYIAQLKPGDTILFKELNLDRLYIM